MFNGEWLQKRKGRSGGNIEVDVPSLKEKSGLRMKRD